MKTNYIDETKYYSYEECKIKLNELGIKKQKDYNKRYKELNNEKFKTPSQPYVTYKDKGWVSCFNFFDTKSYYTYDELKCLIHNNNIQTCEEYILRYNEFESENGTKAPRNPARFFHEDGEWLGWGDFLPERTKKVPDEFYTYNELKKVTNSMGVKNQKEYIEKYKLLISNKKAPMSPRNFYGPEIWEGWSKFLGKRIQNKKFYNIAYSYDDCKTYIQTQNLKSKTEFAKVVKGLCEHNESLVSSPCNFYKDEFEGWGKFLGTNNIKTGDIEYVTFEEAKIWVQSLNFIMQKEWKKLCMTGLIPYNIPNSPNTVYKNKGWVDWCDFLSANKVIKMSYGEKKIYDFLVKNDIEFKFDKNIKGCKHKCQLRFDFQVIEKNVCIEFDGEQHFKAKKYYGGEEEFKKVKARDEIKNLFCEVNNIKLIRLSYKLKDDEIYEILKKSLNIE